MDNEAILIMNWYNVLKVALQSKEEKEQMYQEDRSPKQSEVTPETSVNAGESPI